MSHLNRLGKSTLAAQRTIIRSGADGPQLIQTLAINRRRFETASLKHTGLNLSADFHEKLIRLCTRISKRDPQRRFFIPPAQSDALTHLERVVSTYPGLKQEFRQLPPNLAAVNALLARHGFEMQVVNTAENVECKDPAVEINVWQVAIIESNIALGELETFRRNPTNQALAERLWETNPKEVENILLHELEKPLPSFEVIEVALSIFVKFDKNKSLIKVGERVFSLYKKATGTSAVDIKSLEAGAELVATIFLYTANAHVEENMNLHKAKAFIAAMRDILKQTNQKLPDNLAEYAEYLSHMVMINLEEYEAHLSHLHELIDQSGPLFSLLGRFLMIETKLHRAILIKPAIDGARQLAEEFNTVKIEVDAREPNEHFFQNIKKEMLSYSFFPLAWIYYLIGENEKAKELYFRHASIELHTKFAVLALSACLLEGEGNHSQAVETALEAKKHLTNEVDPDDALLAEIDRIISIDKPAAPTPKEINPTVNVPPTAPIINTKDILIKSCAAVYPQVFPKASRNNIHEALGIILSEARTALMQKIGRVNDAQKHFKEETEIIIEGRTAKAIRHLGIHKITLVWDNGFIYRLYSNQPEAPFYEGSINYDFTLASPFENELKLAGLLIETLIIEKIRQKMIKGKGSFENKTVAHIDRALLGEKPRE